MFKHSPVRFSLRYQVLSVLFIVMVVILILSNALYYWSTKSTIEEQVTSQNKMISQQINVEIHQSQVGMKYINQLMGQELRVAALVAKASLNKDAAKVTNEQLTALAKQLGISGITLFQPTTDDIVGVKSSDPAEVGLSTKGMTKWYPAFRNLLNGHPEKTNFGTAEKYYWTGPVTNATSNPKEVNKWGYYYDGSTNYIIDPFIVTSSIEDYAKASGAPTFIKEVEKDDPNILSVAVLNHTFGSKPITSEYHGTTWVKVANQPLMYGTYAYANKSLDVAEKDKALKEQRTISVTDVVDGKRVIKTFVPQSFNGSKYVVEVVADYALVSNALNKQLHISLIMSACIVLIIIIISYLASGFILGPIRRITDKVNEVAERKFDKPVTVRRHDEIGVLADRVNAMSQNLLEYMHESVRKERGQGVEYLSMVTNALIHELGNPLVLIKYLVEFFPKVQPELSEKGMDVISRMRLASEYATSVVRDFSDFLRNGKLNFEPYNILEIACEVIQVMRPLADSSGVSLAIVNLTGHENVMVDADKEKLRMVLVNLIKNGLDAIDVNSAQRSIHIEVRESDGNVELDVVDTGHGIPRNEWETVFKPYNSTKKNGFGLGLTFCGFVVLSHGGLISVKDSDSTGTTIRIVLPLHT